MLAAAASNICGGSCGGERRDAAPEMRPMDASRGPDGEAASKRAQTSSTGNVAAIVVQQSFCNMEQHVVRADALARAAYVEQA